MKLIKYGNIGVGWNSNLLFGGGGVHPLHSVGEIVDDGTLSGGNQVVMGKVPNPSHPDQIASKMVTVDPTT